MRLRTSFHILQWHLRFISKGKRPLLPDLPCLDLRNRVVLQRCQGL